MSKQESHSDRPSSLLNFIINILIPTFILMKLSGPDFLGQRMGFLVAVCIPLAYGLADFFPSKKANVFSVIGFISIFLTGGIGLLQLDVKWLAIKEAAIPFVLGLIVIVSAQSKRPLISIILDQILNHETIDPILKKEKKEEAFNRILSKATYYFASSFFLSSILNFVLTKHLVRSQAGTQAFNEELGRLTLLSYPIIVVPSMLVMIFSFWYIVKHLKLLTKLELDDLFKQ